ncbi:MAG: N-glycosylase/DNA lyase [Thermoplasmata archaeon]
MEIFSQVEGLVKSPVSSIIDERVKSFLDAGKQGNEKLFLELSFCILTANTSAEMGIRVQKEIGDGFIYLSSDELRSRLKEVKYRFYNVRSSFIVSARSIIDDLAHVVRDMDHSEARDYIVENVKGIGYKEASHFLRNVGIFDFAILDKHIMKLLSESYTVKKNTTKDNYIYNENIFKTISESFGIAPGILDLYAWYLVTGKILK